MTIKNGRALDARIKKSFKESKSQRKLQFLILDEIDQLDPNDLYELFEKAHKPNSKLVLVGIANALDFVHKLNRLGECEPLMLNFCPYTHEEIKLILQSHEPEMEKSACEILARKIEATGDLRKAFEIIKQAKANSHSEITPANVLAAIDFLFSGKQVINFQAQIVMDAIKILVTESKDLYVASCQSKYKLVCAERKIPCVSNSEFKDLLSMLETVGYIKVLKAKQERLSKIEIKVSFD